MRKLLFIALLLLCALPSHAQITHVAADCTGTSSCTTTGNAVGDLEIAYAGVNLSATAPSLATGWTSVTTITINGTSTADSAVRLACKVATGTNEASNTFTNATSLIIQVYRGNYNGTTANCATAILGTPATFSSTVNTTSTTETFNAVTNATSNSWDVAFGYAAAATAGIGTAPATMTNRNTQGTIMGGHDSNAAVASFSSANVTLTTAGRILTAVVEIKAQPTCTAPPACQVEVITGYFPNTASGTVALTFGAPTTLGETIVVSGLVINDFNATPVTDNNSCTYSTAFDVGGIGSNATAIGGGLFYCQNTAAGTTTITCKETASSGHGICVAAHYKGMQASSVVDVSSTFANSGTSPWASGGINSTNANDVMIGIALGVFTTSGNCVLSSSGSWTTNDSEPSSTNFDGGNGNGGLFNYQVVSATQSAFKNTGTNTAPNCVHWAGLAAFKANVAASSCTTRIALLGAGQC